MDAEHSYIPVARTGENMYVIPMDVTDDIPEYVRDIDGEDLYRLRLPQGVPSIASIRSIHHRIAMLLSTGCPPAKVSAVTGMGVERIRTLQQDPTFRELLAHYNGQVEEAFVDFQERLASVGTLVLEELQDRLLNAPETFTISQMVNVLESTFDRSVAPKKGGAPGVQLNFGTTSSRDIAAEVREIFALGTAKSVPSLEPEFSVVSDVVVEG